MSEVAPLEHCRPVSNKPPLKGLNIGIPIIIPIKGRWCIDYAWVYITEESLHASIQHPPLGSVIYWSRTSCILGVCCTSMKGLGTHSPSTLRPKT